jgi:hypothetical protein
MRASLLLLLVSACTSEGGPAGVGDTAPEVTPSATCPVPTMDEQFPTFVDPSADFADADACVASEHDAILILGCPNNDDGTPSSCQTARVALALGLQAEGLGHRFITSGAAVANEYVEADTLAGLLLDAGVPAADIFTDPLAEHTDENLFYGSRIMDEQGFADAIVVSEDPGHLLYSAVSDANCCVELGRLSVFDFPVGGGATQLLGHYALYPWADPVGEAECAHIEDLYMSINLASRRACKDNLQVE